MKFWYVVQVGKKKPVDNYFFRTERGAGAFADALHKRLKNDYEVQHLRGHRRDTFAG